MANGRRQGRSPLPGLLLLAGLFAAAAVTFFLDRLVELGRDTFPVVAMAPGGTRLRPGAEVWLAGRPVGSVQSVEFIEGGAAPDAKLAIRLRLPTELRPLLRRDSEVRLARPRPIADPAIDFRPGSAGSPPLEPGDTVQVLPMPDPAAVARRARALLPGIDSLFTAAAAATPALERRQAETEALGVALERTARGVETLAAASREGSLAMLLDDPDALATLDGAAVDFDGVEARLRARAGDVEELRPAFGRLARRIAAVRVSLGRIRDRIERGGGGTLPRMAADSALLLELRATQVQLDSLVAEARANPLRYVF